MDGNKSADDGDPRIFKGSVLVTALLEHYPRCFQTRDDGEAFSQRLLETGHLSSIHAIDGKFKDSSLYYKWSNDSLFEDIGMYSNNIIENLHIPEKRLSDLIAAEMDRDRDEGAPYRHRYNSVGDSDEDFRSSTPRTQAVRQQQFHDSSLNSLNDISKIPNRDEHGQCWDKDQNQNYYADRQGAFRKLDFDKMQLENEKLRNRSNAYQQSVENMTDGNYCYSDNEKHLIEQMKKMQQEHDEVVKSYEDRITELMNKMHELRNIAELLEKSGSRSNQNSPWNSQDQINREKSQSGRLSPEGMLANGDVESTSRQRAPPPVPPPPMLEAEKPTKPPIKPRVKMRPLFWNRLLLGKKKNKKTIWQDLSEPKVDLEEFEKLFGTPGSKKNMGRNKTLAENMNKRKSWSKFEGAKILEENRSRTVAIKMRSMHCQLDDIQNALYSMDFSTVSVESLQGLYQIRATDDELKKIDHYLRSDGLLPLDEPEQFLYEVSRLYHFKERLSCVVFMSKFSESMFNIDQQLITMQDACQMLTKTSALRTILELVLTFGNYMNGGTQRGQADGFQLDFLNKLKDVKSVQNSFNLLQFILRVYCREYEEDAGQNSASFRLPDPSIIRQAAQVSLAETNHELVTMQDKLQSHIIKADTVARETPRHIVQPFKDKFQDFLSSAEDTLKRQHQKLQDTVRIFKETAAYLVSDEMTENGTNQVPKTDKFMSTWATFLVDCKHYWKTEQKAIAKEQFERVERRKKERSASVVKVSSERNLHRMERRASLKEKFHKIKVENDGKAIQAKELYKRGDTPVQFGNDSRVSSMTNLANGRGEAPQAESPAPKQDDNSGFKPFQRTSALRRSLQGRRRRQEPEIVPHVSEVNPNIELKEPMTFKDTLGSNNQVWSARPTVQEQEVQTVTRVSTAVIKVAQKPGGHRQDHPAQGGRGRESSPATRRRRAVSPPSESTSREKSPQRVNRREISPPPPRVERRKHLSPPREEQRCEMSPPAPEYRRRRLPDPATHRRDISPNSARNVERKRALSPGDKERRREVSPAQRDRRRELSPNSRQRPHGEAPPPLREAKPRRDLPVTNGSRETSPPPPPIPKRERSPGRRRELSPSSGRHHDQPPPVRDRSPATKEHQREISPPPLPRRREQSPAASNPRHRDKSPGYPNQRHAMSQDGYQRERGRTLSPRRNGDADAAEAQKLRAAAERYASPGRRSLSPSERPTRALPQVPYNRTEYLNIPQRNRERSPSPPPIPPHPSEVDKRSSIPQSQNSYESLSNVPNGPNNRDSQVGSRSTVASPIRPGSERCHSRGQEPEGQLGKDNVPLRATSPRIFTGSTMSDRLHNYESKVKRSNSLKSIDSRRMGDIASSRGDLQSRPRTRAPILDNLRQLEEKLQSEISQRDRPTSESDYAQTGARNRRYAAKLVRSPVENGDANQTVARDQSTAKPPRRRPHSYHSLEGSHLAGHFEQTSPQQTYSNNTNNTSDNYDYQSALRSASIKMNQVSRQGKT